MKGAWSLTPEPRRKRQRPYPPGMTANRGREPRQLPACAVPGPCRADANPTKTCGLDLHTDRLAAGVRHRAAVSFEWISVRQPGSTHTVRGMYVTYHLTTRQGAAQQARSRIVAQVLRFIRPVGDEGAQVQARRHHVFVEVEHGEAVRRVPAPALPLREARVEGIRPCRVGDTPPYMGARKRLAPQHHVQPGTRSNRNMSRQTANNTGVSPCTSRSIRERPSSAGIGRRTTAGMRSRLR